MELIEHCVGLYITWRIRLASKAEPGMRVTGVETWPAFTQIMFGN